MIRWGPAILIAAYLSACGTTPVRIASHTLAHTGPEPSERYIIAAVNNDSIPFLAQAGGTPRGYGAMAAYGPTVRAIRVMQALERDYGLREITTWPIAPLQMHCAVLEIPAGADRNQVLATLVQDRRIALAQPLQSFATRTKAYNDPYVGLQRGFQQMDVAAAQRWSQGEGVRVAIIDTGADTQHPDLAGNILAAENFVDSDAETFRKDRHGTEMAGVIAAIANNGEGIVGVAPLARLLIFKACWQTHNGVDAAQCNSFTLARALVAALDAHAQVVNLSLAGPQDPLLRDLIQEGLRRGVLFVGAVSGLVQQPGVIEVSSSEKAASAEGDSADGLALYAPGREILTLLPGGHYDFATGDSISTAQVTGVVALMLAKNRDLSSNAAYTLLRDTSASAAGERQNVDACAALVALVGRGSCEATAKD